MMQSRALQLLVRSGAMVVAIICSSVISAQTSVQLRKPPLAEARTISGIVYDSSGAFIEGATVWIKSPERRVLTSANGAFTLRDLKPGKYEINARKIGFFPQLRTVVVGSEGGTALFELVPNAQGIAAVRTTAARAGLSGVIGDTSYRAIPGATVRVLASDLQAEADSFGVFWLPARPGSYMVRVSHDGYASQLMSVTVPRDSGRKIALWLLPTTRDAAIRERVNTFDLEQRLLRRHPVWDHIVTRDDISRVKFANTQQLARFGAGGPVDDNCPVRIDGGPQTVALFALDPDEIEMMEVSVPPPPRRTITSIPVPGKSSSKPGSSRSDSGDCKITMIAWLRK
ncbi:MAG: carboxypeptidase regulatory-like domain-containing protein [Gemmatimonadaceae bacterium]